MKIWASKGKLLFAVGDIPAGVTVQILVHGGDQKLVKYVDADGREHRFNVYNKAIEEL